jgi:hypothetical protein
MVARPGDEQQTENTLNLNLETCSTCRAWRHDETAHPTDLKSRGRCHKHTPEFSAYGSGWPPTKAGEWCAEWQPRPIGIQPGQATGLPERLRFRYAHPDGETADCLVKPLRFYHGESPWHEGPQWLLDALDLDKRVMRTFALNAVLAWLPLEEVTACPE